VTMHQSIRRLLHEIGPGRMSSTAYDTAWVARLIELGEPIGEQALEWLRDHQLLDGSWGAEELKYYHDRLVCTLAAMTVLAKYGTRQDHDRVRLAQFALEEFSRGLEADPAGETIGFEMIVPTLLAEAESLGVIRPGQDHGLSRFGHYRQRKLASLPQGMINRFVTVAFSSEMAGPDALRLLDTENLKEKNGSVATSPSATAYYVLNVQPGDQVALEYLRGAVADTGGVPNVIPFDVFEQAWTLWNLALTDSLDDELLTLVQPRLDFLQAAWEPGRGVGHTIFYTPNEGDDTSLTHEVLARFGRPMDVEAVLHYEQQDHFRCFDLEANPSISTNVHVLGALRQSGLEAQHPSVRKALSFLHRMQTAGMLWLDKWHTSPYYTTAHVVIACAGYDDALIDDAIYWILATQSKNGSWGYYVPTAEETAYCLQALVAWTRNGGQVPSRALKRGRAWLADHAEPPYPPLWIGKCLYCPELVVRSAILSALALVTQE
jgi:halimadienyl-diphosphate synthase